MSPAEQQQLRADVEVFCQEIRPSEELCYVEHRFNDQVVPLGRKHNILAIPVPIAKVGRGRLRYNAALEESLPHDTGDCMAAGLSL